MADGALDVFAVAQRSALNPWDYLAGLLILRESGGVDADYLGDELVTSNAVLRHPVFCASSALLGYMLDAGRVSLRRVAVHVARRRLTPFVKEDGTLVTSPIEWTAPP